MSDADDSLRWLTYREAAAMLGLTPEGVRSLARRKGWSRQPANTVGGITRVLLPAGLHRRELPDLTAGETRADRPQHDGANGTHGGANGGHGGIPAGDSATVPPVMAPVTGGEPDVKPPGAPPVMPVEVALLERIITDKDGVIGDLRQRLDAADRRADNERERADQAERRLDAALAAQRQAADEVKALRAAIDQRRNSGLLRRVYAALRRV